MTFGWNYAVSDWESGQLNNWQQMCKWLDYTLPNEWDYFNGEYRFTTERAKMLFLLRWCCDRNN